MDKAAASVAAPLPLAARIRLRSALFLAGASVMLLQVLGTRIIGPHYGVGLYVWTALISVTLVALALGYWCGGTVADRHPTPLGFACVLIAAAAAVGLIPLLRGFVLEFGWNFGLRGGALLTAGVLFFPPLFLLGMVSPYAIRLEARGVETAGRSAGRLYAISTTGSVAGVLMGGFFLVPHLRVPTLLALTAGTLAFAAVLAAAPGLRKRVVVSAILVIVAGVALARPRPMPSGLVAALNWESSDLRVIDHKGQRFLLVDQTAQSALGTNGRPLDKYAYLLASRVLLARPDARNAAVIGLGGGSLVPLLAQEGMIVDAVEISPEVIHVARDHFGMDLPPERVHEADGRVFLAGHPGKFDVVVLDAFSGDRLATTLVSREGLATAKASLARGGLLALNTWGIDLGHWRPNRVGASIRATLEGVFAHVLAVPAAGNLLFFASDEPIGPRRAAITFETFEGPMDFQWNEVPPVEWPQGVVLTDDWNPSDTLEARGLEATRAGRRAALPPAVRSALVWE